MSSLLSSHIFLGLLHLPFHHTLLQLLVDAFVSGDLSTVHTTIDSFLILPRTSCWGPVHQGCGQVPVLVLVLKYNFVST